MELILARVLPKLKNITNFKVVLLSATLNKDEFLQRAKDAGLEERYVQVMDSEERHQGSYEPVSTSNDTISER